MVRHTNHDDEEDVRHDVGLLRGETLTIKLPPETLGIDETPNAGPSGSRFETGVDESFTSIGRRASEDAITVKLEAGRTYLRVGGVDVVFDGFRYFPRDPDQYPEVPYRGDVGDATVDFAPADGSEYFPDSIAGSAHHPAVNTTVADLIDGLRTGSIEPLPRE